MNCSWCWQGDMLVLLFIQAAMVMKEGETLLNALVFVGLYQDEKGVYVEGQSMKIGF
ncbi:MAG: hypothetical protein NC543_00035 [bacterium]|nr:hypothetical protein [bacterium]MCM1376039.1 hypothetical protein [Muribaculum sp.]